MPFVIKSTCVDNFTKENGECYWTAERRWSRHKSQALTFAGRKFAEHELASVQNLDTPIRLAARIVETETAQ